MAISNEDLQYVITEVLKVIKQQSQDVAELPVVGDLTDVNALPALKNQAVVSIPISLLAQPAMEAAAAADAAAYIAYIRAREAEAAAKAANEAALQIGEVMQITFTEEDGTTDEVRVLLASMQYGSYQDSGHGLGMIGVWDV
ncbi:MAG: hypothetical protein LBN18_02185 [Dysgonamonadaceae bacterium]|jgi:hypothetical protein|nr:hypothetical protein [Dysgonamonadaceae bacterium]